MMYVPRSFKHFTFSTIVFLGVGISFPLVAQAAPDFVWSDIKGLVVPYSCTESTQDRMTFAITAGLEPVSGQSGIDTLTSEDQETQFLIPRHSVVRAIGELANGGFRVEVLGSSKSATTQNIPNLAERGWGTASAAAAEARQRLILPAKALRALDNYVIQVHDNSLVNRHRGRDLSVRNTFWQVAMSGEKYNTVQCETAGRARTYYLFNVFSDDARRTEPVAVVGVSERETEIFSQITGHHVSAIDEQNLLSPERLERRGTGADAIASRGNSVPANPGQVAGATPQSQSTTTRSQSNSGQAQQQATTTRAQQQSTSAAAPRDQSSRLAPKTSARPVARPSTNSAARAGVGAAAPGPVVAGVQGVVPTARQSSAGSAIVATMSGGANVSPAPNPQTPPTRPNPPTQANEDASAQGAEEDHAHSEETPEPEIEEESPLPAGVEVASGGLDQVVCIMDGSLRVREQNLSDILFTALPFEKVKTFQGWDSEEKQFEVASGTHTFKKVQFPERQGAVGWVAKSFITPRSECKPLNDALKEKELVACTIDSRSLNVRDDANNIIFRVEQYENLALKENAESAKRPATLDGERYNMVPVYFTDMFRGGWIPDEFVKSRKDCPGYDESIDPGLANGGAASTVNNPGLRNWLFPLRKKALYDYNKGPYGGARYFGARRSGGSRLHAAADLFGKVGDAIEASHHGEVIRIDYFYSGTWQVNVKHTGGYVIRYGEVSQSMPAGMQVGRQVRRGERIAKIGKLNCSGCGAMLHFELYRGNLDGSLTQRRGRYQRRGDLMDPTEYLLLWEMLRFSNGRRD